MRLPVVTSLSVLALCAVTRASDAQTAGCAEVPVLTPATQTASDLRCFPLENRAFGGAPRAKGREREARAAVFPLVLGSLGAAAIGTFIGFGIGGSSLLANGATPQTLDSVRIDYAIANVALAVGLTSLVTAVVLALVRR